MKIRAPDNQISAIAAVVAPEDLRRGDFVAVLSEIVELPSFFWDDVPFSERSELVRLRRLTDNRLPLRIEEICLPFVFVRTPADTFQIIDVRASSLARLGRKYAKAVRKALKSRPTTLLNW